MSKDGISEEADDKGITTIDKLVEESFFIKTSPYSEADTDKILRNI